VPAHTVSVYVEHGSSVEAGVKDSELPTAFHVPATAGLSIGAGEPGAGDAERRTTSAAVPSTIVPDGRPVRRVRGAGFTDGVLGVPCPAGVVDVEGLVVWVVVVVAPADVDGLAKAVPVAVMNNSAAHVEAI
jgi:hypothetical protein